jgi:hypothetical protein
MVDVPEGILQTCRAAVKEKWAVAGQQVSNFQPSVLARKRDLIVHRANLTKESLLLFLREGA